MDTYQHDEYIEPPFRTKTAEISFPPPLLFPYSLRVTLFSVYIVYISDSHIRCAISAGRLRAVLQVRPLGDGQYVLQCQSGSLCVPTVNVSDFLYPF